MLTNPRSVRRRLVLALGLALSLAGGYQVASQLARAGLDQPSTIPVAWSPPTGAVRISPCVPKMGEHWANPDDLPLGPIYNVHNGQVIAIEYSIAHDDFTAGKNWVDLTFRYSGQPLTIEHTDIEFQPAGHPGYLVPHYDLHFYLVTDADKREITCQ